MNLLGTRSTRNRDLARPPAVIKGKHWLIFCRVRDSIDLEPVVDLGNQPWCNHFLKREELGKEPSYPLRLVFCERCCTSQLDYTLKKQVMFGDHTCLSDVTRSLSNISLKSTSASSRIWQANRFSTSAQPLLTKPLPVDDPPSALSRYFARQAAARLGAQDRAGTGIGEMHNIFRQRSSSCRMRLAGALPEGRGVGR
jgi:Putative zinc binding domain